MKIELTDDWHDPFLWIDPKTKNPIRLDAIPVPLNSHIEDTDTS